MTVRAGTLPRFGGRGWGTNRSTLSYWPEWPQLHWWYSLVTSQTSTCPLCQRERVTSVSLSLSVLLLSLFPQACIWGLGLRTGTHWNGSLSQCSQHHAGCRNDIISNCMCQCARIGVEGGNGLSQTGVHPYERA